MKIIDLLNKIANGEEVPKKIKYNGKIYNWEDSEYFDSDYGYLFDRYNVSVILNSEVEIVEENKIPEKLKILNANYHSKEVYYENYSKEEISLDIKTLQNWVNKIIDYLKSKGEE